MTLSVQVFPDKQALGRAAAEPGRDGDRPRPVGATRRAHPGRDGRLPVRVSRARSPGYREIDWAAVEMFHLDEYVGLPADHPASFRKYLLERLIVPTGIRRYHFLDGTQDPVRRLSPRRRSDPLGADRLRVRGHRRERTPRVQRSAGRLRDAMNRTSSSSWTKHAGDSRSARDGSRRWRTCRRGRSRSRSVRSWLRARSSAWCRMPARPKRSGTAWPVRSARWRPPRSCRPIRIRRSIWTRPRRRCLPGGASKA